MLANRFPKLPLGDAADLVAGHEPSFWQRVSRWRYRLDEGYLAT